MPRRRNGEYIGETKAELDVDWLRGFEHDAWRLQWTYEIARALLKRATG
jgi:hypothetical protein